MKFSSASSSYTHWLVVVVLSCCLAFFSQPTTAGWTLDDPVLSNETTTPSSSPSSQSSVMMNTATVEFIVGALASTTTPVFAVETSVLSATITTIGDMAQLGSRATKFLPTEQCCISDPVDPSISYDCFSVTLTISISELDNTNSTLSAVDAVKDEVEAAIVNATFFQGTSLTDRAQLEECTNSPSSIPSAGPSTAPVVASPTTLSPIHSPTASPINFTEDECAALAGGTGYSWCQLTSTCLAPGDDACKEAECEQNSGSTGYSWCELTRTCLAPGDDSCKVAECEQNSGSTGYSWCVSTRSCIPPSATCGGESRSPTQSPVDQPSSSPSPVASPTAAPTNAPTGAPSDAPTDVTTTSAPTNNAPTAAPTTNAPTDAVIVCVAEGGHCVPDDTHLTTTTASIAHKGQQHSCCESLRCQHGICSSGDDTLVDIPATLTNNSDTFSTLIAALDQADLVDNLSSRYGPYTVFGPTNAAFDALPTGLVPCLFEEQNKPVLTALLQYHVAYGELLSKDFTNGLEIPTLRGRKVVVGVNNTGTIMINDSNVIAPADILASNGVIHAIDAVLVPSNIDVTAFLATCLADAPTNAPTKAPTNAPTNAPTTPQQDITEEECAVLADQATGYSWCPFTRTCLAPGDDSCKAAVCEQNSGSTGYSWCTLTRTCLAPGDDTCKEAECAQNSGSTGYSWCMSTRTCLAPGDDACKIAECEQNSGSTGYSWCESTRTCLAPGDDACKIAECEDNSGSTGYAWCELTRTCLAPSDDACKVAECGENSGSTGYSWCKLTRTCLAPGDDACKIADCEENSGSTGYAWCELTRTCLAPGDDTCKEAECEQNSGSTGYSWCKSTRTCLAPGDDACKIAECEQNSGSTGYSWCVSTRSCIPPSATCGESRSPTQSPVATPSSSRRMNIDMYVNYRQAFLVFDTPFLEVVSGSTIADYSQTVTTIYWLGPPTYKMDHEGNIDTIVSRVIEYVSYNPSSTDTSRAKISFNSAGYSSSWNNVLEFYESVIVDLNPNEHLFTNNDSNRDRDRSQYRWSEAGFPLASMIEFEPSNFVGAVKARWEFDPSDNEKIQQLEYDFGQAATPDSFEDLYNHIVTNVVSEPNSNPNQNNPYPYPNSNHYSQKPNRYYIKETTTQYVPNKSNWKKNNNRFVRGSAKGNGGAVTATATNLP